MKENPENKPRRIVSILLIVFVATLTCFSTWQLFSGNLEAAFSTLPFLLILYLFVIRYK